MMTQCSYRTALSLLNGSKEAREIALSGDAVVVLVQFLRRITVVQGGQKDTVSTRY